MPDRSSIAAWIAAIVLIAAAAGGYLIWLHRTRAGYHARSLSASNRPANAQPDKTRTLHVDGCQKEFLVKIGELVEPQVIPGAPLPVFEQIYGSPEKPGRSAQPQAHIWDTDPFTLSENALQPPSLHLAINQGHVVQTLDDIELGIDSFAAIFRKARDRNLEIHERIRRNTAPSGNSWTLTVSFDSSCSRRFRSEYSRTLASTPEIDRQINPAPAKADGQISTAASPYRSSVFMNKMVSDYTMVLSNGQSDSSAGSPSEHE
ncbi:MAG TPA: hypothetical protein VIM62_13115 [Acidobacteriaceae bacterium]